MAAANKKTKICLVIHSLQAGGMERVMSELASYFSSKANVETHLILYGLNREIFYKIPDNVIVHKPKFSFNNKKRLVSTLKTIVYLRKTILRIAPDSVLSFGEYWNNFVLLSMLGTKYPVYVSDRSQPDKSLGKLQDYLRRKLYPTAKGVVLQTEKGKTIFLKSIKHPNIAVIGNPIRELGRVEPKPKKEKIVIMVGRLIRSKNQDKLIEVFAGINAPDWKLMLVGYDHLKQKNMDRLKMLAKDLGVENSVVFTGKHDKVEELYRQSAIFAFTSSSEGFPNVIGEAMSAGLPVVAFDCVAGPSEMINDGQNGFLVPLFDTTQFKDKLSLLMNDSNLREKLGANARQSIQRFSKDSICEEFYRFITN
ncbi:GalNAc-alpha-(1-_4)-GalNAc-alpha-(1-_3)-diNAcBac-PP-undecaprenol alpha-1,4-N-acetyl-D-galactosaminyltransferase [Saccharicrinis carchari]|uniref:GalNAc-alpha-(1->4)-GalNAc-alpha-(1->3)-diNAcBac-PP-undecaprenol alpha-1,4-N-acetyl-D-galactosaminyltransferase n=1 Tax=Saccharicrinis carchari TaxID=1168039 RepID=A0A521BTA6_SACCC|nr:glycosyltransferase family 4 protein [Saccharicrinis carchari]SMO50369.1 GalNAc-alpha-(1->4)-GalNAc-alpha-(1->3)-diNAcBac-PP-undecaprenol alpha-1,4-N-acetyl-D-galactosaminyltransferase [Saccharicrinis carchari]